MSAPHAPRMCQCGHDEDLHDSKRGTRCDVYLAPDDEYGDARLKCPCRKFAPIESTPTAPRGAGETTNE